MTLGYRVEADGVAVGYLVDHEPFSDELWRADLRGDGKWPDSLESCDRFFWAVPAGFNLSPFEEDHFRPDCCGLMVADRYDAAILREAPVRPLPAARRKVETLRFARRAARRILADSDPDAIVLD